MITTEMQKPEFDGLLDFDRNEMLTMSGQIERLLTLPVFPLFGLLVLFGASFMNLLDVQVDKDTVALDKQVLLKLAILAGCGIYGGLGFLLLPKVRRTLLSFPILWMVVILGCYLMAVPTSMTQTESLASTMSIACILLMTATVLQHVGPQMVLNVVFAAMTLFVALSWVAFFLWPAVGVFAEPITDGEFQMRMSGLAHPNTLGQFSGMMIVVGFLLRVKYEQKSLWIVAAVVMAAGALIGSLSRTSLLATIVAITVVHRNRVFIRGNLIYALWIGVAGLVGLMFLSITTDIGALIMDKISFLSKSGDAEELTSATGRADIWGYAIRMISERPLTGYGAATTKYHLVDYSSYTHNMILNIAFSSGVIGGLAALSMCLGRVWALFKKHHDIADALVAFILINGLFENVIFSFLAGMPTIVWTIGLALPAMESDQEIQPRIMSASLKERR
ncbi:MAG: O-antigen ligase family protein [Mariniblastus sp.]